MPKPTVIALMALVSLLSIPSIVVAEEAPEDEGDAEMPEEEQEEREARSSTPGHHMDGRAALLREDIYESGRWSLGLDGLFNMTRTSVELLEDGADDEVDSTRFLRIDPSLMVTVVDRLAVGMIVGVVHRRFSQEVGQSSTETALAFQPSLRYYLPFTNRLAGYTQASMGYFRGSSDRFVNEEDPDGDTIGEVDTRTRGFALGMGLGVNYRLSDGLQLRFGLAFDGLWGRESVDELDERLSISTTNLGTSAGVTYTF